MNSTNTIVAGALGVALLTGGGWAGWSYFNQLPDCSNEGTISLLKKIVRIELAGTDDPKLMDHFNALVKVDINAIETLSFTKDPARYQCEAEVRVDLGSEVQSALGIKQEMLDTPNLLTAIIIGPTIDKVYGPLDNLRVKFTSSWAKDQGDTKHYVTARMSNPGATGYATLTEIAWAQMQQRKADENRTSPQKAPQGEPTRQAIPEPSRAEIKETPKTTSLADEAQRISFNWLDVMSRAQTGDGIAALYAIQVDFYGKSVNRDVISREKSTFVKRWPQRQYKAIGSPVVLNQSPESITWSLSFGFDVADTTKSNKGQSKLLFTAKPQDGTWLIVSESKGE